MEEVWFDVPTRGNDTRDRGIIGGATDLVPAADGGLDAAASGWAGTFAANVAVILRSLWNVHHVTNKFTPCTHNALE
jgi:hypothetical protein